MLDLADPADLDNGPRTTKSGTERMCAVTREVRPIDELIRFVMTPDGAVVADLKRKLPGRGLWVTASRKAVAEAARKNVFARGFKRAIKPQPTLADDTEQLLVRGAMDALAMAAKARQAVAGYSKVENALTQRQVAILLHASDGAVDGIRKLDGLARQSVADDERANEIPIVTALNSEQLDLALGRSNVIHAAVLAGPASKSFLSRCQVLVRYRMAESDKTDINTTKLDAAAASDRTGN
ncbi:MAG: hypothetical protein JWR73_1836 [Tardiphaga sp.]|jgi:predicted RNA-binding protein YlxR (DUF448 family)|nr:hypothetical protein [Tardiphaga sp.]MDB5573788.1 hypothetical protein [Tardiphaga sp.]MDB5626034.1 hypothetical protein [Tardiphaga sp.]MDB5629858.1 hypothetical protein [Tardiphaga sp.]